MTATVTAAGLRLERVSMRFGGVHALSDVSFALRPGEVHCLAGENGSGKSTLIKIVCGLYRPEHGARIVLDGVEYGSLTPAQARTLGIQVIWQDLALFPEMSVAENIAFEQNLGRLRWVRPRALRDSARAALARLGVELNLQQPLRELTIARRQIVAICRALVAEARIVFMDEPTASLTQAEAQALFQVVQRLAKDGIAVVFVSHRLAEVLAISERVTILRDGRLVGVYETAAMTAGRLTELMTGQVLKEQVHARDVGAEPAILETRALSRRGEYRAVSLSVRRGEILGITGLLGAGRTELALSLFGLTQPDSGTILLAGRPVRFRSNKAAIRAGISYVSEDRLALGLIQPQSIADNIVVSLLDRLLNALRLLDKGRSRAVADDWIKRLAIKIGRPEDAVATLSGGNQQRVVLAKWLATEPKVLLLDSPTVGVDVGARAGIFEIVRGLAARGMAIILISDEIPEVYANADRILHMRAGRLVGEYDPRTSKLEVIEEAVHA